MQLGDLNGDGLSDIWQPANGEAHIWVNTGNGQFVLKTLPYDSSHLFTPLSGGTAQQGKLIHTAFVDYDADGRLDILEHWKGPDDFDRLNVLLRPDGLLQALIPTVSPHDLVFHSLGSDGAVFDAPFNMVGDLDGDGNPDLFGPEQQLFFGSGLKNQLLKSIKDGSGKVIHVQYDLPTTYTATCSDVWPEKCLKHMRGLVSFHDEGFVNPSDAVGGGVTVERSVSYTYANARVNVTGHGWLGFDHRTVTRASTGLGISEKVATDFWPVARFTPAGAPATDLSAPYLYPLAGMTKRVVIDQPTGTEHPLEDLPTTRRETVDNTWVVKLSADNRPFPFLSSRDTASWSQTISPVLNGPPSDDNDNGHLRSECVETNLTVDGYGNVLTRDVSCQNQRVDDPPVDDTFITTQFAPDRVSWLVGNPELITTVSSRNTADQTQVVDPEYDANGLLQSVTRAPLAQDSTFAHTSYARNEFGNITHISKVVKNGDAERVTDIAYDADQVFPFTVTASTGEHTLTTTVLFNNRFGGISKLVDPNGVAVRHAYDSLGLLASTVGPSGTTTYAYGAEAVTPVHTPAGVIFPTLQVSIESEGVTGTFGGATVEEQDPYGRLVRTRSQGFGGDPVITERAYDARGRVIGTSAPHLADAAEIPVTAYGYDFLDRPVQIDHAVWSGTSATVVSSAFRQYASVATLGADNLKWLSGLDCGNNTAPTDCATDVTLSIDEEGQSNVVLTDYAGHVVRSIDGENLQTVAHTSNYQYGPFGRLLGILDNANNATGFVYDDYGRLTSHIDPDTNGVTYTYNGFDEVSTSLDSKSQLRQFNYDTLGRLRSIFDAVAGETTWDYDDGENALGQLTHSSSPPTPDNPLGQQIDYTYEPATPQHHRALPKTVSYLIDGVPYSVGLAYDDLARPDTIDYPQIGSGAPIRAKYTYDSQSGSLASVTENGSGTERPIWKIDSAFQGYLPQQETFGNGAVTTFDYDSDRRWLNALHTTLAGNTVQDLSYSHYENGQVHERITPEKTEEFTYDAVGRVASLLTNGIGTATPYHYDPVGNITLRGAVASTYQTSSPHLVNQVGANTYHYDANGNLEARTGPDVPGGSQSFAYTPFDLPKVIIKGSGANETVTELDYDADGSRVVRRDAFGSRHFVAGLYERLQSPTGATLEEHFRLSAGSGVVAEIIRKPASEETFYFHQDHLGTPETISDNTGNVTHQEYGPFGELIGNPPFISTNTTRIGFTGQQQDNDLALTDMGGRLYDPIAARFTTADPVMQAPFWSQGLNRYSYVANDPLNMTDPSGFDWNPDPTSQLNDFFGTWDDAPSSLSSETASSATASSAGSTVVGTTVAALTVLNGAMNVIDDFTSPAFTGSRGGTYQGAAPSASPNSTGHNPQGSQATMNSKGIPGPPSAADARRDLHIPDRRVAGGGGEEDIDDDADWDEIVNGPRLEPERNPFGTTAEQELRDEIMPYRMRPVPRTAVRRAATAGDTQFRTANDALREALQRHGIDPSTIEVKLMYGKNPNLVGPQGEPWEIVRGLNSEGKVIEVPHHANGHFFEDANEFELPHYEGPNGEHLSY